MSWKATSCRPRRPSARGGGPRRSRRRGRPWAAHSVHRLRPARRGGQRHAGRRRPRRLQLAAGAAARAGPAGACGSRTTRAATPPRPGGPRGSARGRAAAGGREPRAVALERMRRKVMAWRARTASAPGHDAQAVALLELARRGRGGPRDSSDVCGTSHIRPSSRPSRPAHEQDAAVPLDEGGGDRHVDGRAARAGPPAARPRGPAARARQCSRSGQAGQAGLRGRQTVAPSSMSAWFQSPGPLAVEQLLGAVVVRRRRGGYSGPRRASRRASTRRTLPSTTGSGRP